MKKNHIYWNLLSPLIIQSIRQRFGKNMADMVIRNGKKDYDHLVENAPDLGNGNSMASNAYFAYVFVGSWLATEKQLRPQEIAVVMTDVLAKMKPFFSLINLNKDPKYWDRSMKKYAKWYDNGNGEKYPDTWHVRFDDNLHKDGAYYYFTSCPICAYLTSIGLGEIMKPLCETDSVMFAYQHGILHREHTIASGSDICDYWIVGDKVKDPQ